ncbi:Na+/H+ antiporter subunit E [Falsirhodobacter deserti]|uniref:Na+/H+ antiporter subunit E n=1 Tax=Falsirhodobacter deserti TaxID=1365611 RepID=UPI000FE379CB|nr:Na+/H+ antiporter subunit E [Falsirhodobacter deserti]
MKRIIPHPILTLVLLVMWLILTQFTLGQAILGTAVALVAARALAALEPQTIRIRRWSPIPGLFYTFVVDILWSNVKVGRAIMSRTTPPSGLIEVELDTRDRNILAIISVVIAAAPGTAWLGWNPGNQTLLLHLLDIEEGEIWEETLKKSYLGRLKEIFG